MHRSEGDATRVPKELATVNQEALLEIKAGKQELPCWRVYPSGDWTAACQELFGSGVPAWVESENSFQPLGYETDVWGTGEISQFQ